MQALKRKKSFQISEERNQPEQSLEWQSLQLCAIRTNALMEDATIVLKVTLHLQAILERSLQHLEEECLSSIHMYSATIV